MGTQVKRRPRRLSFRSGEHARPSGPSLVLPVALVVIGVLIACAPLLMDLRSRTASREEISRIEDAWSAAEDAKAEEAWRQARAYNRVLAGKSAGSVGAVLPYEEQLAYDGWPCICYVQVESVGIELPVYRGTSEDALSSGAGHVRGTSLPVGGKSANCCISAHSGIASGSMFDGLRDVEPGATVTLRTLGRTLGYRVVDVKIVDADDSGPLGIVPGKDLLTLITCTSDPMPGMPRGGYGVNDRRLVVVCERYGLSGQKGAPDSATASATFANGRLWPVVAICAVLSAVFVWWGVRAARKGRRPRGAGRADR